MHATSTPQNRLSPHFINKIKWLNGCKMKKNPLTKQKIKKKVQGESKLAIGDTPKRVAMQVQSDLVVLREVQSAVICTCIYNSLQPYCKKINANDKHSDNCDD
jgi:hypothetical protein